MPSCFYKLIYCLKIVYIPTALLICMENTSRAITKDWNFVELFKKSFTSYVENGMSQLVETDIEILRNEHGGFLVTKDFKAKFYKFIVDHYLRKFHCFLLHLTPWHLTTVLPKYSPTWGVPGPWQWKIRWWSIMDQCQWRSSVGLGVATQLASGKKKWKKVYYLAAKVDAKVPQETRAWWGLNFVRSWILGIPL